MLLDDVQFFFDYFVRDVESGAAAVDACVGPKRVAFDFQMRRNRFSSRRFGLCLFADRGDRLHRWLRSFVESLLCVAGDDGWGYGRLFSSRLALSPLRDRQQLANAVV
jgi:hypothetical protein